MTQRSVSGMCLAIAVAVLASGIIIGIFQMLKPQPTPDQVYGCSARQQLPDGDCP